MLYIKEFPHTIKLNRYGDANSFTFLIQNTSTKQVYESNTENLNNDNIVRLHLFIQFKDNIPVAEYKYYLIEGNEIDIEINDISKSVYQNTNLPIILNQTGLLQVGYIDKPTYSEHNKDIIYNAYDRFNQ